jgi:RNA polymerase sigma factor (sigma-70 family)
MRAADRPEGWPDGSGATSEEGFETFFRTMFPRAIGLAHRITADRASAEDAALEALAKAHFRWRKLAGAPWREAWVMRVATNEAIRRLPRPQPPMRGASAALQTDDPTDAIVLRETLGVALRTLPRRQCEVIVLRYLVGLSENEVASTLHISRGTVKTHLRRGLASLRVTVARNLKEEPLARLT